MVKKFLSLPFSKNNQKAILGHIANKPEDRFKYEILRGCNNSDVFKFGIWYNPISKAGYRMKPVEFPDLHGLAIELPRVYMSQALIYKVWWCAKDLYSDDYAQYLCLGGIYVPECLEMVSTAKRSGRWIMKPEYDNPEQFIKPLRYPPKLQG